LIQAVWYVILKLSKVETQGKEFVITFFFAFSSLPIFWLRSLNIGKYPSPLGGGEYQPMLFGEKI
jgi:hypothetical protein